MKKIALIIAAVFVFPALASAGWMIDSKSSDGEARKTYIDGSILCESTHGDYSIIDMKTRQITIVNNKTKAYATATLDEIKKMAADFRHQTEKAMSEALKSMPAEQQAAYKKMIGSTDANKSVVKVQKISEEKIAGFNSAKYHVLSDNKLVEEIWISEEVPFFDNEFKQNADIMAEAASGIGGIDHTSSKAYLDLMKNGYPVKQRSLLPSEMSNIPGMAENWTTEEVKSIQKMDVTRFITVPAGYKKNSYAELMQTSGEEKK